MSKWGGRKTAAGNPHISGHRLPSFSISDIRNSLSGEALSHFNAAASRIGDVRASRLVLECSHGGNMDILLFKEKVDTAARRMGRVKKKYSHRARR